MAPTGSWQDFEFFIIRLAPIFIPTLNDLAILESQFGSTEFSFDLDANGIVDQADSDFFVNNFLVTEGPGSGLGDFNEDDLVNVDDIDFYLGSIGLTAADSEFDARLDLDSDGTIELEDLDFHVSNLVETSNGNVGTFAGDANLDGTVNVLDDAFALIGNLGSSASSWSQGDFNADGIVTVLGDAFLLISNLGQSN